MKISRRTFVKTMMTATIAGGTGAYAYRQLIPYTYDSGPIDAPVQTTLSLAAEALLTFEDYRIDPERYRPFYAARAERVPLCQSLFNGLARRLHREAGGDYDALPIAARREIVVQGIEQAAQATTNRIGQNWPTYNAVYILPTYHFFSRTDGWVVLGYENYPGVPRGLDDYTQPMTTINEDVT